MNPKKLGGMANHRQEPWKVPLPQYVEELYRMRFKRLSRSQLEVWWPLHGESYALLTFLATPCS